MMLGATCQLTFVVTCLHPTMPAFIKTHQGSRISLGGCDLRIKMSERR